MFMAGSTDSERMAASERRDRRSNAIAEREERVSLGLMRVNIILEYYWSVRECYGCRCPSAGVFMVDGDGDGEGMSEAEKWRELQRYENLPCPKDLKTFRIQKIRKPSGYKRYENLSR